MKGYLLFTNQKEEFIRYRDFYSQVRTKAIQTQIKKTISQDPRQTGANVARIIIVIINTNPLYTS